MTRSIFAYLDPGSSSMILQIFLGGLAAVGVTLKLYWRRFLRLLGLRKDLEDKPKKGEARGPAAVSATAAPEAEPVESTKG